MIEPVGEQRIVAPGKRRDHADVGHVAARKQQGARQADEAGQRLLQRMVRRAVPQHQMRGAGAHAVARDAFLCRLRDPGIGRQTQIVVAAKCDELAPLQAHARRLRGLKRAPAAPEPLGLEFGELRG